MDYNRAGQALLEIVSEPDMRSGQDAAAYGAELRRIMVFLGVSDGEMSVSPSSANQLHLQLICKAIAYSDTGFLHALRAHSLVAMSLQIARDGCIHPGSLGCRAAVMHVYHWTCSSFLAIAMPTAGVSCLHGCICSSSLMCAGNLIQVSWGFLPGCLCDRWAP